MTTPRVRFAPSPTGRMHVGNARTALFNWLFARRQSGTFLLRIEDTDDVRNHPEWVEVTFRTLRWLGLDWDGEPTYQSARFDQHRKTAETLFADGKAYYCDCTQEALQARKAAAGIKTPGYDSFCADRGLAPGDGRGLRFRIPRDAPIHRVDAIAGTADIDPSTVEDFFILRATGTPLYVFANALDDIADEITHVVRGIDHLANTTKQIALRGALGVPEPVWAHLPMINNAQGKPLSKRRDNAAVERYRDDGYLPEAFVNYLATLGWAPPNELGDELATMPAMAASFSFDDVNTSPAMFDEKKLVAFNGFYLRRLPEEEFIERSVAWLRATVVDRMAPLLQERAERLPDSFSMIDFLVHRDTVVDLDSWRAVMEKDPDLARSVLKGAIDAYAECEWIADALKAATEAVGDANGLKLNKAQAPIRVAVTGRRVGPPLFESLVVLGQPQVIARLERALQRLNP